MSGSNVFEGAAQAFNEVQRPTLVVGSNGLLGRLLMGRLGPIAIGLDQAASQRSEFVHVVGSAAESGVSITATSSADYVVDTAGLHGPDLDLGIKESEIEATNLAIARSLCDSSEKSGVQHLIYVSTAAVYGRQSAPFSIDEDTPPNPGNGYSLSKLLSERIYLESSIPMVTVVRPARFSFSSPQERFVEFFEAAVDIKHLAGAIVAMLGDPRHNRQIVNLVSPPLFPIPRSRVELYPASLVRSRLAVWLEQLDGMGCRIVDIKKRLHTVHSWNPLLERTLPANELLDELVRNDLVPVGEWLREK